MVVSPAFNGSALFLVHKIKFKLFHFPVRPNIEKVNLRDRLFSRDTAELDAFTEVIG